MTEDRETLFPDCRCDGNPQGSCSYPDCQLPPPTTEELLGEPPKPQADWREHAAWEITHDAIVVECPGCGFAFHYSHVDADTGRYSCPSCGCKESELAAELREISVG